MYYSFTPFQTWMIPSPLYSYKRGEKWVVILTIAPSKLHSIKRRGLYIDLIFRLFEFRLI
jgi:hypothetical protein